MSIAWRGWLNRWRRRLAHALLTWWVICTPSPIVTPALASMKLKGPM